jgi:hypothetical protein
MLSEVDVFISNYTLVDPEVYQLWVDGYSCKFISNLYYCNFIIFMYIFK